MKKQLLIATTCAIVSCFLGLSMAGAAQLSISTGSMGGGFYAIGGGIAAYMSKSVEGVRLTAVTSGGVDENINRLDMGKADIGLVSTGDSLAAFRGMDIDEFRRRRHLPNYEVTPEWVLHHLAQHEAEHRGQIEELVFLCRAQSRA